MAEKVLFKKEMTRNSLIWSCRCEVNSVQSESWWGWLTRWRGCYEYVSPKMPLQSLLFSILWSISLMHNLASKRFDHLEIIEMSIFISCGLDSSRSSWTPIVEFHPSPYGYRWASFVCINTSALSSSRKVSIFIRRLLSPSIELCIFRF